MFQGTFSKRTIRQNVKQKNGLANLLLQKIIYFCDQ